MMAIVSRRHRYSCRPDSRPRRPSIEREGLLHDLEVASRAKDEFLAMLGHELRNPLAPIVTALHLMKRRGDLKTSREQEIIHRQVQHLIRLVDDLLDISRITRGKVALRKETVELAEVVGKAVEMAHLLVEQRQHRLNLDVPSTGLRWHGDPTRLAQVVANLLTNAARYTPPGGAIELSVSAENGWATIVGAGTTARASRRTCCPGYSICSFRGRRARSAPKGVLASAWRWSRAWSRCMAALSRRGAPASGKAASS